MPDRPHSFKEVGECGIAKKHASRQELLTVAGEHLLAGFGQSGAIFLETAQDDKIALIHHLAAITRDITGTGFLLLLCAAALLLLGHCGSGDESKYKCRQEYRSLQNSTPTSTPAM